MISPTGLNLALRLVFAYQHQPHLLDDAESFRKVTGLSASGNAETLGMVRGIIECLQNGNSGGRDGLGTPASRLGPFCWGAWGGVWPDWA
jgi:hypothetical protein